MSDGALRLDIESGFASNAVGLVVPEHLIQIERKPIAVDLFCGAEAKEWGGEKEGWQ